MQLWCGRVILISGMIHVGFIINLNPNLKLGIDILNSMINLMNPGGGGRKQVKKEEKKGGSKAEACQIRVNKDLTELDLPEDLAAITWDKDDVTNFKLVVFPVKESFWYGGKYNFTIKIP